MMMPAPETDKAIGPAIADRPVAAPPDIAAERCVHHRAAVASCRACADACPRGAWIVDDDGVALDATSCDNCGLCAPACPQGVISHSPKVARRMEEGQPIAFAACAHTGLRNGQDGVAGVLPCLGVLGLADLAGLYRDGVRRLVVTRECCAACPSGRSADGGLERAAEELNRLLAGRGLPPLKLTRRSPTPWRAYLTFDSTPDKGRRDGPGPAGDGGGLSRRALFRRSARRLAGEQPEKDSAASHRPPGRLLPPPAPGLPAETVPWPWVPSIDTARCDGCAGCARLCPTGAIALDTDPPAFRITAEDCTGCRLCVDVCSPGALILERLAPRRQTHVALHTRRCPSCGVLSRLPADPSGASDGGHGLCPVCRRTGRAGSLFQVLD